MNFSLGISYPETYEILDVQSYFYSVQIERFIVQGFCQEEQVCLKEMQRKCNDSLISKEFSDCPLDLRITKNSGQCFQKY